MGFKKDQEEGTWTAWYSKRHPKTGQAVTLKRIGLKSEAEAKRVEKQLVGEVLERIEGKIIPTWAALITGYLSDCRKRGLTEKSIYNAERCLKAATLTQWGERKVNSITTEQIRDLVTIDFRDNAATHRKAILKFIRGAFAYAVDAGVLDRNPAPKLAWRSEVKFKKVLTEEQVRILLQKAKELDWEWYPHIALAVYTGMRNGELFALRWEKVNLKNRQAVVDESWNNKDGYKSTKSGDDRMVELAPGLIPLLEELKLRTLSTGFVLPHLPRWEKGEQARELRMFLMGIGLPEIRFHDLRATWATLMMSKGVEPIKVMIMGGWKDLKTMQIYMRKAGVDIKGITNCLELHSNSKEMAKVLDFSSRS